MRFEKFYKNEVYHVYGNSVGNRCLFSEEADYTRFIFLATHLQSPIRMHNVFWYVNYFLKKGFFPTGEKKRGEILNSRNIELLAFSLTNDSFDLLVKNMQDSALSVYMQRLLTGYSKYYNSKYNTTGHVFSTVFKSKQVKDRSSMAGLSAVIHKKMLGKPVGLEGGVGEYPWSSYGDYVDRNRWGDLLNTRDILETFKNPADYRRFVSEY